MSFNNWLPLLIVMSSLVPGLVIFLLREESHSLRTLLNLSGAVIKLLLVGLLIWGVYHAQVIETRWTLAPGLDLVLHADALSVLFVTLSTLLWLLTTIYAIGYLENAPHRSRFFGFFSLCVTATVGLALAGNLFTFVIFYEMLTLATYPLVAHKGSPEALRGARIYLAYTLSGGILLLIGTIWLRNIAGPLEFAQGGILGSIEGLDPTVLGIIFLLLITGLGVKAALVPLHGWLPQAMVAPAPVSALLHAVAVVKAGAFGIVRVVYDVYGIEFAASLGLITPLAVAAGFTIVYGSLKALSQDHLKKRLAYSTVSQVSYIALGAA
ncbi:MAG: proton-conducting transporter membrane subunit, partial [Chromatiales bacterium]